MRDSHSISKGACESSYYNFATNDKGKGGKKTSTSIISWGSPRRPCCSGISTLPLRRERCNTVQLLRTNLLPRSTPADASELWPELAGSTALLLPVLVTVGTGSTVSTLATLADAGGAGRTSRLFVCGGDDLSGEVKPIPKDYNYCS